MPSTRIEKMMRSLLDDMREQAERCDICGAQAKAYRLDGLKRCLDCFGQDLQKPETR